MLMKTFAAAFALAGLVSAHAHAETGVTDTEIHFGASNAQSGPASALGKGVTEGIQVYFDKINAAGGVHGRTLKLTVKDDGYEPPLAARNTLEFINDDGVFALMGYVGTPTAKVVMPLAVNNEVPYFAPFTGAGFLRNPVSPYVFNVRGSYVDETVGIVDHLVADKGYSKIGLLMQNDGYGKAGEVGVLKGLEKNNLELAARGTYERNTLDIRDALDTLEEAGVEAVIMVGAYKPVATFMKLAHARDFKPDFVNISFVGTSALIKAGGAAAEGSYISQVMPNPFTSELAIVQQFRTDMEAAGKALDFTSLEGYVQAAILVEGLKNAGKDLTRASFTAALNGLNFDLGGLPVAFSADNHQALNSIYFTKVDGGKPVSIEKF